MHYPGKKSEPPTGYLSLPRLPAIKVKDFLVLPATKERKKTPACPSPARELGKAVLMNPSILRFDFARSTMIVNSPAPDDLL